MKAKEPWIAYLIFLLFILFVLGLILGCSDLGDYIIDLIKKL